jgi:hypothetical protein
MPGCLSCSNSSSSNNHRCISNILNTTNNISNIIHRIRISSIIWDNKQGGWEGVCIYRPTNTNKDTTHHLTQVHSRTLV